MLDGYRLALLSKKCHGQQNSQRELAMDVWYDKVSLSYGCAVNSGCRVLLRIVADSDYEISGLDGGRHDFQTYTTQAALWIHI